MESCKRESDVFINNYAKLRDTITDIDNIASSLVSKSVILFDDLEEVNSLKTLREKVFVVLKHISHPLRAGNPKNFYTLLTVMEEKGVIATKQLAQSIRSELESPQSSTRNTVDDLTSGLFSSLFSRLWSPKERRILILGLDGAGKTTILYRLQVGEVVTTIPTIGFNVETVTYKNLKFQVWDLGGQTSIRPYWRCYYSNTDAIIYVVDSADRDRLSISKSELVSMLEEEELRKSILMVFANKQDLEGAMTPSEISNALGLSALKNRTWSIFKTSATKGEGLEDAMEWLVNTLQGASQ